MAGTYQMDKGSGNVCLIQQYGGSRANVAHFYGPDAAGQAREALDELGWQPTHVRIGDSSPIPLEEWV